MTANSQAQSRFVRRTQLGPNEYRKNFRQIDCDAIAAVSSEEACRVTPLMSKVYLRLIDAPARYWEREGVLRFVGELREDTHVTAWETLCELVGVASATARKALRWMQEQGIIGYFAGKNGVGLRVFLNRASSSIGSRAAGQKILEFRRTSSEGNRASRDEAAFNDSYADVEVLEKDLNPRAPKNGAGQIEIVKNPHGQYQAYPQNAPHIVVSENVLSSSHTSLRVELPVEEIILRLKGELEPVLQSAARHAAVQEHERTRQWLESRGLPKAARVAQREAFNVLRRYGVVTETTRFSHGEVGRSSHASRVPTPLPDHEIEEMAQACVAMLKVQGQPVEATLSKMSVATGGFLLPEDAPRVLQKVNSLIGGLSERLGG